MPHDKPNTDLTLLDKFHDEKLRSKAFLATGDMEAALVALGLANTPITTFSSEGVAKALEGTSLDEPVRLVLKRPREGRFAQGDHWVSIVIERNDDGEIQVTVHDPLKVYGKQKQLDTNVIHTAIQGIGLDSAKITVKHEQPSTEDTWSSGYHVIHELLEANIDNDLGSDAVSLAEMRLNDAADLLLFSNEIIWQILNAQFESADTAQERELPLTRDDVMAYLQPKTSLGSKQEKYAARRKVKNNTKKQLRFCPFYSQFEISRESHKGKEPLDRPIITRKGKESARDSQYSVNFKEIFEEISARPISDKDLHDNKNKDLLHVFNKVVVKSVFELLANNEPIDSLELNTDGIEDPFILDLIFNELASLEHVRTFTSDNKILNDRWHELVEEQEINALAEQYKANIAENWIDLPTHRKYGRAIWPLPWKDKSKETLTHKSRYESVRDYKVYSTGIGEIVIDLERFDDQLDFGVATEEALSEEDKLKHRKAKLQAILMLLDETEHLNVGQSHAAYYDKETVHIFANENCDPQLIEFMRNVIPHLNRLYVQVNDLQRQQLEVSDEDEKLITKIEKYLSMSEDKKREYEKTIPGYRLVAECEPMQPNAELVSLIREWDWSSEYHYNSDNPYKPGDECPPGYISAIESVVQDLDTKKAFIEFITAFYRGHEGKSDEELREFAKGKSPKTVFIEAVLTAKLRSISLQKAQDQANSLACDPKRLNLFATITSDIGKGWKSPQNVLIESQPEACLQAVLEYLRQAESSYLDREFPFDVLSMECSELYNLHKLDKRGNLIPNNPNNKVLQDQVTVNGTMLKNLKEHITHADGLMPFREVVFPLVIGECERGIYVASGGSCIEKRTAHGLTEKKEIDSLFDNLQELLRVMKENDSGLEIITLNTRFISDDRELIDHSILKIRELALFIEAEGISTVIDFELFSRDSASERRFSEEFSESSQACRKKSYEQLIKLQADEISTEEETLLPVSEGGTLIRLSDEYLDGKRPTYDAGKKHFGMQRETSNEREHLAEQETELETAVAQERRHALETEVISIEPSSKSVTLLDHDEFVSRYQGALAKLNGRVTPGALEPELSAMWHSLFPSSGLEHEVAHMTKAAADRLIAYPSMTRYGLAFHELPRGFVLCENTDSKPGTKQYYLDYDADRESQASLSKFNTHTRRMAAARHNVEAPSFSDIISTYISTNVSSRETVEAGLYTRILRCPNEGLVHQRLSDYIEPETWELITTNLGSDLNKTSEILDLIILTTERAHRMLVLDDEADIESFTSLQYYLTDIETLRSLFNAEGEELDEKKQVLEDLIDNEKVKDYEFKRKVRELYKNFYSVSKHNSKNHRQLLHILKNKINMLDEAEYSPDQKQELINRLDAIRNLDFLENVIKGDNVFSRILTSTEITHIVRLLTAIEELNKLYTNYDCPSEFNPITEILLTCDNFSEFAKPETLEALQFINNLSSTDFKLWTDFLTMHTYAPYSSDITVKKPGSTDTETRMRNLDETLSFSGNNLNILTLVGAYKEFLSKLDELQISNTSALHDYLDIAIRYAPEDRAIVAEKHDKPLLGGIITGFVSGTEDVEAQHNEDPDSDERMRTVLTRAVFSPRKAAETAHELGYASAPIAMSKILFMVKHSIDPATQFEELAKLPLNSDAYYAKTFDNYYFVTYDMYLDPKHRFGKANYKIDLPELRRIACDDLTNVETMRIMALRTLGRQIVVMQPDFPIASYRDVFDKIMSDTLSDTPQVQKRLMSMVVTLTTDDIESGKDRGSILHDLPLANLEDSLNRLVQHIEAIPASNRLALVDKLDNLISNPDYTYTLYDISLLASALQHHPEDGDFNQSRLLSLINENPSITLSTLYTATLNPHYAEADNAVRFTKAIENVINREDLSSEHKTKILELIARSDLNFTEEEINTFIYSINKLDKSTQSIIFDLFTRVSFDSTRLFSLDVVILFPESLDGITDTLLEKIHSGDILPPAELLESFDDTARTLEPSLEEAPIDEGSSVSPRPSTSRRRARSFNVAELEKLRKTAPLLNIEMVSIESSGVGSSDELEGTSIQPAIPAYFTQSLNVADMDILRSELTQSTSHTEAAPTVAEPVSVVESAEPEAEARTEDEDTTIEDEIKQAHKALKRIERIPGGKKMVRSVLRQFLKHDIDSFFEDMYPDLTLDMQQGLNPVLELALKAQGTEDPLIALRKTLSRKKIKPADARALNEALSERDILHTNPELKTFLTIFLDNYPNAVTPLIQAINQINNSDIKVDDLTRVLSLLNERNLNRRITYALLENAFPKTGDRALFFDAYKSIATHEFPSSALDDLIFFIELLHDVPTLAADNTIDDLLTLYLENKDYRDSFKQGFNAVVCNEGDLYAFRGLLTHVIQNYPTPSGTAEGSSQDPRDDTIHIARRNLLIERLAAHLPSHLELLIKHDDLNALLTVLEKMDDKDLAFLAKEDRLQQLIKNTDGDLLREIAKLPSMPKAQVLLETLVAADKDNLIVELRSKPRTDRPTNGDYRAKRAFDAIHDIEDFAKAHMLDREARNELEMAYSYIHSLTLEETSTLKEPLLKHRDITARLITEYSDDDLQKHIKHLQNIYHDDETRPEIKKLATYEFMALATEAMFRTQGIVPWSTQVLAVMNAEMHGGDVFSQIDTGQGKTTIIALHAALCKFKDPELTYDIATSNDELARVGVRENTAFYNLLGHRVIHLNETMDEDAYCEGAIHYASASGHILHYEKRAQKGITHHTRRTLSADECDAILIDDMTAYQFSVNLEGDQDAQENEQAWIYPVICDIIDNDPDFASKTRREQIEYVSGELQTLKNTFFPEHRQYVTKLCKNTVKIDRWVKASLSAKHIVEHNVTEDFYTIEYNKNTRMARAIIMIDNRKQPNSRWSDGVHQFVHARLSRLPENKDYHFIIEPEKSSLQAVTVKNFVDSYKKGEEKGNVYGWSGTIGSMQERFAQRKNYAAKFYSIPPFQSRKRRDHLLVTHDSEFQDTVLSRIETQTSEGPVLIVCDNIEQMKQLKQAYDEFLTAQGKSTDHVQAYAGTGDVEEKEVVRRAGESSTVTFTTAILGRGTDIKLQDESEHLSVVITTDKSVRDYQQIAGRTGRKGSKGETYLILPRSNFSMLGKKVGRLKTKSDIERAINAKRLMQLQPRLKQHAQKERVGDLRDLFQDRFRNLMVVINNEIEARPNDSEALTKYKEGYENDFAQFLEAFQIEWQQAQDKHSDDFESALAQLGDRAYINWQDFTSHLLDDHAELGLDKGVLHRHVGITSDELNKAIRPDEQPLEGYKYARPRGQHKHETIRGYLPSTREHLYNYFKAAIKDSSDDTLKKTVNRARLITELTFHLEHIGYSDTNSGKRVVPIDLETWDGDTESEDCIYLDHRLAISYLLIDYLTVYKRGYIKDKSNPQSQLVHEYTSLLDIIALYGDDEELALAEEIHTKLFRDFKAHKGLPDDFFLRLRSAVKAKRTIEGEHKDALREETTKTLIETGQKHLKRYKVNQFTFTAKQRKEARQIISGSLSSEATHEAVLSALANARQTALEDDATYLGRNKLIRLFFARRSWKHSGLYKLIDRIDSQVLSNLMPSELSNQDIFKIEYNDTLHIKDSLLATFTKSASETDAAMMSELLNAALPQAESDEKYRDAATRISCAKAQLELLYGDGKSIKDKPSRFYYRMLVNKLDTVGLYLKRTNFIAETPEAKITMAASRAATTTLTHAPLYEKDYTAPYRDMLEDQQQTMDEIHSHLQSTRKGKLASFFSRDKKQQGSIDDHLQKLLINVHAEIFRNADLISNRRTQRVELNLKNIQFDSTTGLATLSLEVEVPDQEDDDQTKTYELILNIDVKTRKYAIKEPCKLKDKEPGIDLTTDHDDVHIPTRLDH